jgi:hypothetical protein
MVDEAPKAKVTRLMLMIACGITMADMKFREAKPIPSLWKATMLSCVIT